ncbi:MAG: hypothetical protein ACFFCQ_16610 [Promethearchaeota archaeon]
MKLKDLWIISRAGLCLYHYQTIPSDYDEYENLFSGYISAFSSFSTTISNKQIDYLSMGTDELHFLKINEITIASTIINPKEKVEVEERAIIRQILEKVGKKFLKKYSMRIKQPGFNSDFIRKEFDQDIVEIYQNSLQISQQKLIKKILNDPQLLHLSIYDQSDSSVAVTPVGNEITFEEVRYFLHDLDVDIMLVNYKYTNKLCFVSIPKYHVNVVAIFDDSSMIEESTITHYDFMQFSNEINELIPLFLDLFPLKPRIKSELLLNKVTG